MNDLGGAQQREHAHWSEKHGIENPLFMAIYTRTGDKGTTSLFGGKRVLKSDLQVEAYGSIDELTSFLGLTISKVKDQKSKVHLIDIQKDLYKIMAYLAGAKEDLKFLDRKVTVFEKRIDEIENKLPKLTRFILPGGNEISSLFQVVRTLCRKSERNIVRFFGSLTKPYTLIPNPFIVKYLNRLSDLFFTFARLHGKREEITT